MAASQLYSAVCFGCPKRVKASLNPKNVRLLYSHKRTILHIAVERDFIDDLSRLELVTLILSYAPELANEKDMWGFTPLHVCAASAVGGAAVIEKLVAAGK
jgi:hypothetical protein